MKKSEWRKAVRTGCKQKHENNNSGYGVYCRKKGGEGGPCTFENCPSKARKG